MTSSLFLLAWAIVAGFAGVLALALDNQLLAVGWFQIATIAAGFWAVVRSLQAE